MKNANPVSFLFRAWVVLTTLMLATGCGQSDSGKAEARTAAVKTVADFFTIPVGDKPVRMQLAVKPHEMERGLMGRTDLKTDEGMLFLYTRPQQQSFWMRNTPSPLDIGFFLADGTLKEIYSMYPFDETPVKSRSEEVQFALEMKQGWFEFNGVKPGAKLDLKALGAALNERGFEPAAYGAK